MKKIKLSDLFFLFCAFLVLWITCSSCSAPQARLTLEQRTDSTEIFVINFTHMPDTMFKMSYPTIEQTGREMSVVFGPYMPVYRATVRYSVEEKAFTDGAISALQQVLHNVSDGDLKEFSQSDTLAWAETLFIQYIEQELKHWE